MTPEEAILSIWKVRAEAAIAATQRGSVDIGRRSEVTSGTHMNDLRDLVVGAIIEAGVPKSCVFYKSGLEVPGYFRPQKKWDIVVARKEMLFAAIELKAIGSSYGKNLNNRAEEAVGNAVDLRRSVNSIIVGDNAPWVGYVFVIRDEEESRRPVGVRESNLPIDSAFLGLSYQERAALFCRRLMDEGLYNQVWFVTVDPTAGNVREPDSSMSWTAFKASIESALATAFPSSSKAGENPLRE